MAKPRTHLDATPSGWQHTNKALCGWMQVTTSADPAEVTCKKCLAASRSAAAPKAKRAGARDIPAADLADVLAAALHAANLAPTAGPPPVLTPDVWATVCRGSRCGTCVVCLWEAEADKWASVEAWTRRHHVQRAEDAPQWGSLDAALVALANWEQHDRWGPSAMGPMLQRLEMERDGTSAGTSSSAEDRSMKTASEIACVRQALDRVYGTAGADNIARALLHPWQAKGLLLARTGGVLDTLPTYEALAAELSITAKQARRIVMHGRRQMTIELAARGLIRQPKPAAGLADDVDQRRTELDQRRTA